MLHLIKYGSHGRFVLKMLCCHGPNVQTVPNVIAKNITTCIHISDLVLFDQQ